MTEFHPKFWVEFFYPNPLQMGDVGGIILGDGT